MKVYIYTLIVLLAVVAMCVSAARNDVPWVLAFGFLLLWSGQDPRA